MMMSEPVRVWGLPLAPWTRSQAVDAVAGLIRAGRPSYFITSRARLPIFGRASKRKRAEMRQMSSSAGSKAGSAATVR